MDYLPRKKMLWQSCCFMILFASAMGQSCKSGDANKSCGQCIKQGPDCAWCGDANFSGNFRCDQRSNLDAVCRDVYQPKSEVTKPQNEPLGSMKISANNTQVQIQPQKIKLKIRPGETLTFQLKYLHVQPTIATIYALNSEVESQGYSISYSANCRGEVIADRKCEGVRQSDIVEYDVSIRLTECKTSGDTVVSIGISGLRDVSALYISPICGCECEKLEKQERQSAYCNGYGTLVCGKCVCDSGRGGSKCECAAAGSQDGLEDQCRQRPGDPVCSGRGKCECGQCKCDEYYYSGSFCECDDTSCDLRDGIMCYGKGECKCGRCVCESGWTGRACDCSLAYDKCLDSRGGQCNGRGTCDCNKCTCYEGYSGDVCEQTDTDEETTTEPEGTGEEETESTDATEATETQEAEETTTKAGAARFLLSRLGALGFTFAVCALFW